MRDARSTRDHLPLLPLIALLIAASFLTSGCGKDTPPAKAPTQTPSKAPSPGKTPAGTTPAVDIPAAKDPLALEEPAAPAKKQIQRQIAEAKVTISGSKELDAVIKGVQTSMTQIAQLTGPAAEACKKAVDSEMVLGDQVIEITPPAPYDHGQYLPADMQLVLPLTPEQCDGATARNVGVLHITEKGVVEVDGYYDEARSAVIVEVPHLSRWVTFRRDPLNEITAAVSNEASRRAIAERDLERVDIYKKLIKSVEEYLKHKAFDKFEGHKSNILAALSRHNFTVEQLFAVSGGRDSAGFFRSFQGFVGKVIVDNIPSSDMPELLAAVSGSTDTTAAVTEAAGGAYWAAVEVLGNAYAQNSPGYRDTVEAGTTLATAWRAFKDEAMEELFEAYCNHKFDPYRMDKRPDSLTYLQRTFRKANGEQMTEEELLEFIQQDLGDRFDHDKKYVETKAEIERIHAWYTDRPELAKAIKVNFNKPNDPDCFRRFLRILDTIHNHLMRMGIGRSPRAGAGFYLPQGEVVEMIGAFERGGVGGLNQAVKDIERRLARPLDLSEYGGFWILADSTQKTLSTRQSKSTNAYTIDASAERERPQAYMGDVKLRTSIAKHVPGQKPDVINFEYRALARIAFDSPPAVVPNGTNWEVALDMEAEEFCTTGEPDAFKEIVYRIGSPIRFGGKGAQLQYAACTAAVIPGARNRVRVRTPDDLVPVGTTHFNAGQAQPWDSCVPVRFTLIPEATKSTTEEFVLILEARTPGGAFREEHTYKWSKILPRELETELQKQILRDNFRGVRSSKADMSAAATAKATELAKPAKTVAGSKTQITDLKYVPQTLVVKKEAAFELTVENGPRVPSFAWSFGETNNTDSWTTINQCKYTYYKPGTFTVTVKMRDKNNYAKGNLATASWEVTVVPEDENAGPTTPTTTPTVAKDDQTTPDKTDEPDDDSSPLKLTFPVGRSPKVFTKGWLFGAECIVKGPDGEDVDLSEEVRWSGTGKFNPAVGSRSRPVFKTAGANTITLAVQINGKEVTRSFKIDAVFPITYAAVLGKAFCPADAHGGPAGAMPVIGPIQTGSPLVLLDGRPAARVGDVGVHASCDGPNTFRITEGDPQVLIDGRPAARIGSRTEHCGGWGTIISTRPSSH